MAQTLDQFVQRWTQQYSDFDGWYGAQCVDLINFYHRDVIGGSFVPAEGAKDWFENFPKTASDKYDKITNNMNDPNQLPSRGDIVIWGGRLAGSGGYGHIAIVLSADKKGFTSFDQNFPTGSLPHQQYHTWTETVLGWLHPKSAPAASPAPAPAPAAPRVTVYGDYRTLYKNAGSGQFQRIAPNQFGGSLNYPVLERSGEWTKIRTNWYGDAWIFTGKGVEHLTQFS